MRTVQTIPDWQVKLIREMAKNDPCADETEIAYLVDKETRKRKQNSQRARINDEFEYQSFKRFVYSNSKQDGDIKILIYPYNYNPEHAFRLQIELELEEIKDIPLSFWEARGIAA